jgi:peroxin-7
MNGTPTKLPPRAFKTQLSNMSCKWSPFEETKLAVASAENYGMLGKGAVTVLNVDPMGIQAVKVFNTPDACMDVCFNEGNGNQILSSSGDGTLSLWDLTLPDNSPPVQMVKAHEAEVNSVAWNHINAKTIVTASNDMKVNVWDATTLATGQPVASFAHDFTVYQAMWHPTHDSIIGSCSGD